MLEERSVSRIQETSRYHLIPELHKMTVSCCPVEEASTLNRVSHAPFNHGPRGTEREGENPQQIKQFGQNTQRDACVRASLTSALPHSHCHAYFFIACSHCYTSHRAPLNGLITGCSHFATHTHTRTSVSLGTFSLLWELVKMSSLC